MNKYSSTIEGSVLRVIRDQTAHVEWKLPNFNDLPHRGHKYLQSSTFLLSDVEWFLRIYPNYHGVISLEFRQKPPPQNLPASFTIEIKRANGATLKIFYGNKLFKSEDRSWIAPDIPIKELLDSKNVAGSDGSLTVFLKVRILDGPTEAIAKEAASQTPHLPRFEILSQNFKDLYLGGRDGDVTFKVKDRTFVAHTLVLTARSTVFQAMFKADMVEKNNSIVNISDSDAADFENFLLYLYSGELNLVSANHALGLYFLADKYSLQDLKDICADYLCLEINPDSFCDIAILSYLHNETKLLETATAYFVAHANDIFPTQKWTLLMAEHLTLANELLIKMGRKVFK